MLRFDIHDEDRRGVRGFSSFSFSELARLSKPGRLDCPFGVVFAGGVGVEGSAVVVSETGCDIAGGVTGPGKEAFLSASCLADVLGGCWGVA